MLLAYKEDALHQSTYSDSLFEHYRYLDILYLTRNINIILEEKSGLLMYVGFILKDVLDCIKYHGNPACIGYLDQSGGPTN